ncbi:MAG: TylF/MycF/NovP-related O-methyltransferase [Acidimicrobiales bacterium]
MTTPLSTARDVRHHVARARTERSAGIRRCVEDVRAANLTYLERSALIDLATLARQTRNTRGVIVEAGSALGGSAMVLAAAKNSRTPLHLYDVFGTIPPPTDADGESAARRFEEIASGKSSGIGGEEYYGYRGDLLEAMHAAFCDAGLDPEQNEVVFHPGLFDDTMDIREPVVLAHLDCDWYDSVQTCLERIWPQLVPNGVIVIDDYFYWEGCRRAVDDFVARTPGVRTIRRSRVHLIKVVE